MCKHAILSNGRKVFLRGEDTDIWCQTHKISDFYKVCGERSDLECATILLKHKANVNSERKLQIICVSNSRKLLRCFLAVMTQISGVELVRLAWY